MFTAFENETLGPLPCGRWREFSQPGGWAGPLPAVLVVEDDETLLPVLEFLVDEARPGCRIAWARSSSEAEAWLNASPLGAAIRVVISDLCLSGGKNGIELWEQYAGKNRAFLVISGAGKLRFQSLLHGERAPLFLPKPLPLSECMETLKLLLENPGWF